MYKVYFYHRLSRNHREK